MKERQLLVVSESRPIILAHGPCTNANVADPAQKHDANIDRENTMVVLHKKVAMRVTRDVETSYKRAINDRLYFCCANMKQACLQRESRKDGTRRTKAY
jgi:hypothetical protein